MRSLKDISTIGGTFREAFTPPPSDWVDARVLTANAPELHAVQTDARVVVFSATGDFWVRFGSANVAAQVPTADVIGGTASELNPAARALPDSVTHISLVATSDVTVTLAFYGL